MHRHEHRRQVLERQDFRGEGREVGNGRGGVADDGAFGDEVGGFDGGEVEDDVVTGDGPVGGVRVDVEGLDAGGGAAGLNEDGRADLEGAGIEAAGDGNGVLRGGEDVGDGHAERGFDGVGTRLGGVEGGGEGGAGVPGRRWVRGFGEDI